MEKKDRDRTAIWAAVVTATATIIAAYINLHGPPKEAAKVGVTQSDTSQNNSEKDAASKEVPSSAKSDSADDSRFTLDPRWRNTTWERDHAASGRKLSWKLYLLKTWNERKATGTMWYTEGSTSDPYQCDAFFEFEITPTNDPTTVNARMVQRGDPAHEEYCQANPPPLEQTGTLMTDDFREMRASGSKFLSPGGMFLRKH